MADKKKTAGDKMKEYKDAEEFQLSDLWSDKKSKKSKKSEKSEKSKKKTPEKKTKPTKPLGKHLSEVFKKIKNKDSDKK